MACWTARGNLRPSSNDSGDDYRIKGREDSSVHMLRDDSLYGDLTNAREKRVKKKKGKRKRLHQHVSRTAHLFRGSEPGGW